MKKFLIKAFAIGFLPSLLLCSFFNCLNFPQAYGLCIICHARDLVNFLVNSLLDMHFFTYGSFLTTLGVVVGSYIGAKTGKKSSPLPGKASKYFFIGFVTSISALLMGMCTARIALLIGWGSLKAIIYLVGVLLGVLLWLHSGIR